MSDRIRHLNERIADVQKTKSRLEEERDKAAQAFDNKATMALTCPQCCQSKWFVFTSYDPTKKMAWESRLIKFKCSDCGFEILEYARTDYY